MVLLAPLLALGSKSTSLNAGIHVWVQAVRYNLFSSGLFLPYFSMLILSLRLLELGSKSACLSPGFYVRRPRQYNTICLELNLISGFSAFYRLIDWADGINKCGLCLAGGRGFKGLHQIPSVSWKFHHCLHFHIYYIVSFLPGILSPLYCYYKWWWEWIGEGWLIYTRVWVGERERVLSHSCCFFFITHAFVFCSVMSSVSFFKSLEHDRCCVCFCMDLYGFEVGL